MQWREAVLSSLKAYSERHGTRIIQRQAFIADALDSIVAITETRGDTPSQTLSRVLQDLRDENILEFLTPGEYLLLDTPINVEDQDLPDYAIDQAVRARRLLLGIVPTENRMSLSRRRRGQARIHALTVQSYHFCCAVCDVTDPALLVASHIVGWAEAPEDRGDLSNVICLCRIHDALFEEGYWSLDDCLGVVRRDLIESKTIRMVLDGMGSFRSPLSYAPSQLFVKRHRERAGL